MSDSHEEDPTPNPIVKKVQEGAKEPGDALVVYGYLGSPDDAGIVRIYLDLSLQAYFELEWTRVLHCDKVDPANETSPTKIVIDASESLKLVQTYEASFLKGAIASAYPIAPSVSTGLTPLAPGFVCTHSYPIPSQCPPPAHVCTHHHPVPSQCPATQPVCTHHYPIPTQCPATQPACTHHYPVPTCCP